MNFPRKLAALSTLLVLCAACGESGSREIRPIEAIFFVQGATGAQFRVVSAPEQCGGESGLRGDNADHQLPGRVFDAPHFFVLQNVLAPVRGTFQAISEPILVTLALGTNIVRSRVEIQPGECRTIADTGDALPPPEPRRPEIRFELTSGSSVQHVAFFATVGDSAATYITSCLIDPLNTEGCRTPATFFFEEPFETISGIFSMSSNQGPGLRLHGELYIDGELVESDTSDDDVILARDL